jgi:glycosyltransferase involved in cell wall biosynthesis
MSAGNSHKVVLFIMPRSSKAWVGAEALWITVAGWSAAAKRKYGNAWVITSDKIAQPADVIHYPLSRDGSYLPARNSLKWIPQFLKILVKDIMLYVQTRNWGVIIRQRPWVDKEVAFVWQQHDLFPGPGRKLASELNVPLVTYVHAPVVWEAAKWGVKRYFWGWFLERFVELRSLNQSDLIGCVSEEVAQKLVEMGIDRSKIIVSPMAVDPSLFGVKDSINLKSKLNLRDNLVIGWTGSFRSFHGLDILVKAFKIVHDRFSNTRLLLVGDGFEKNSLEELVNSLNLNGQVIFAGRQPFSQIPTYVSLFDVAIVSARSSEGFHYSPLKLREYLAAKKATLAPNAGEIPELFRDKTHLLLYETGNTEMIANKLFSLIENENLRTKLGQQGYEHILNTATWDVELNKITQLFNLS